MNVKKLFSLSFAIVIVFSLFASCDLMKDEEPKDPQIRIQVESESETWYFAVGFLNNNTFYNSTDWLVASGGYSDYVSVEEGTFVFGFDDSSDHSLLKVITDVSTKEPMEFTLRNNRKYTIIFGADGYFHSPEFPDL